MRFKKYAEYASGLQPITVAPFVNIAFLVFIFGGVCVAHFVTGSGLDVEVPRAITSIAIQGAAVHIEIPAGGGIRLNGQELTVGQLQEFLKVISGRRQTIVINADKRAPWESVASVWDAVRASGLRDCVVATHP